MFMEKIPGQTGTVLCSYVPNILVYDACFFLHFLIIFCQKLKILYSSYHTILSKFQQNVVQILIK